MANSPFARRRQVSSLSPSSINQSAQSTPTSGSNEKDLSRMDIMDAKSRSQIAHFYENRSVLITGGSGFIGKALIEKLLRTCTNIKNIFVLIRPKWNKQPQERLQELLEVPLFDKIRESDKSLLEKVIVVEGDVVESNLGLSDQNLLRIMNEVSVIYHSAATVKFDEPLKRSIGINMTGTKNMVDVCRKIPQLEGLVHISTAYANCDLDEIDEHIYPVDMDPEKLMELASWLDQDTMQDLKLKLLKSKPNTYTYTKSLAEWLLLKIAKDLPVVICRPSIVIASWKEPFAGWVDNANGPTGSLLGVGKGLVRTMMAETEFVADLVPVDTVINLAITLGWFAHIYHYHKQPNYCASSSGSIISSAESMSDCINKNSLNYDQLMINHLSQEELELEQSIIINNNDDEDENSNNNFNNNNSSSLSFQNSAFGSAKGKGDELNQQNNYQNAFQLRLDTTELTRDEGYATSVSLCASDTKSSSISSLNVVRCEQQSCITTTIPTLETTSDDIKTRSSVMTYIEQRRLDEERHAAFEYKLKQFRHNTQVKLNTKRLPEEIADVPVFHCSSGRENPITWGNLQFMVLYYLVIYPSISIYRYPKGSFTNNRQLDQFYRFFLHTIPAHLVDNVAHLLGGKRILVRIFNKFNQTAEVLEAFTMKQWKFTTDNSRFLIEELMSEEDKLLFNCDLSSLDWSAYMKDYVLGTRRFMLKEPDSNLRQARLNLKRTYYRNLSLQIVAILLVLYCILPTSVPRFIINQLYNLM